MNPKARQRRFQRIQEIGCLASKKLGFYAAPDVHHLNLGSHAGQKRLGDEATIGLSPWFHRGIPPEDMTTAEAIQRLGPSLALEPVRFREVFGTDEELLAWEDELIAACERRVIGRPA